MESARLPLLTAQAVGGQVYRGRIWMYRLQKVNSLLVHEVGDILLKEMEFPSGILVTVTQAEVTDDLKQANIFISVLPFDKTKRILDILNKNIYHLQQILNKRLRMKPVPKIAFKIDSSIEEAEKVEKLFSEH